MKTEVANLLAKFCEGEVRTAYRGRDMADETAGIVVWNLTEFITGVVRNVDAIAELAVMCKVDLRDFECHAEAMGKQIIVY